MIGIRKGLCRPIWCTGGRYSDPPTWPLTLVGDPWWTILWQSRLIWTFDISCQWEDFIHNPIIWISLQFEIRVIRKIADNLAGLYKGVTSKEAAAACIFIKQFIIK